MRVRHAAVYPLEAAMCSALLPLSSTQLTCSGEPSRMREMVAMSFTIAALCSSGEVEYVLRKYMHRLALFLQAASSAVRAAELRSEVEAPY
jgi:hypothetical protein